MIDFTCCYCLKRGPEVEPAIAHIFPDAMGGVSYTRRTVCGVCNAHTNQSFEQTEIQKFSFFQGIWGIRSRRKKLQGIPASVDFGGKHFNLYLDERGLPKIPLVLNEKDAAGKKQYSILGLAPKVNEKQKEIEAKIPDIKWTEKELKEGSLPQANIEIASDLWRKSLRRLAAKVAYERWAQLGASNLLDDSQYNNIRNFILNGSEPNPICGLLFDHRLLNDVLKFPVGQHAVVIIGNPQSPKLGAFITFYGLFYFWVSLSTKYQALSPFDYALLEDPQKQKIHEPILRSNTGNLLIEWENLMSPFLKDPISVNNKLIEYAMKKFQQTSSELNASKILKYYSNKKARI